jgi:hypothetical protein
VPDRKISYRGLRRRYRRAQRVSALAGVLVATAFIVLLRRMLMAQGLQPTPLFLAAALLVLAGSGGLPWLLVELFWRWRAQRLEEPM